MSARAVSANVSSAVAPTASGEAVLLALAGVAPWKRSVSTSAVAQPPFPVRSATTLKPVPGSRVPGCVCVAPTEAGVESGVHVPEPLQTPTPPQASPPAQLAPAGAGTCVGPATGSQPSMVQGFPSSTG